MRTEAIKAYQKAWKAANPEKVLACAHARSLRKNPNWVYKPRRKRELGENFGREHAWRCQGLYLGWLDFLDQLAKVRFRCEICQTRLSTSAMADHDHQSGKFRGVLCRSCNFGLGYLKDSSELLESASLYLNRHKIIL